MDTHRGEFMAASMPDTSSTISSRPDSTNFGTYSYNITHQFQLRPKSIKTFPFLSTIISFNYTLETTIYLSPGQQNGLFQRIFTIKPSEFLPAGTITFYLATTGITLGQGRLKDTPKQDERKIILGNDPDIDYNIISIITAMQQMPTYEQEFDVNVRISNRKETRMVSVELTINNSYRHTTLVIKDRSSSNITIEQDPNNKSIIIIRANIKPNENETCIFSVKQSN